MALHIEIPPYGYDENDEPIGLEFEVFGETLFIKVNGEHAGGITYNRVSKRKVELSLNYNEPGDGEWLMKNPITVKVD